MSCKDEESDQSSAQEAQKEWKPRVPRGTYTIVVVAEVLKIYFKR